MGKHGVVARTSDFRAFGSTLVCETEWTTSVFSSDYVEAVAKEVGFRAIGKNDFELTIEVEVDSETSFVFEIPYAAGDLLTHLMNGRLLVLANPDTEVDVSGVDQVLKRLRSELIADGIEPNPNTGLWEAVLWHLDQPGSIVFGFDALGERFYLTPVDFRTRYSVG